MGELIVDTSAAYLCGGTREGEWPQHGQVLPPLYDPRVRRVRGDDLVIVGRYLRDAINVHATQPQAWWCRVVHVVPLIDADPTSSATSSKRPRLTESPVGDDVGSFVQ